MKLLEAMNELKKGAYCTYVCSLAVQSRESAIGSQMLRWRWKRYCIKQVHASCVASTKLPALHSLPGSPSGELKFSNVQKRSGTGMENVEWDTHTQIFMFSVALLTAKREEIPAKVVSSYVCRRRRGTPDCMRVGRSNRKRPRGGARDGNIKLFPVPHAILRRVVRTGVRYCGQQLHILLYI